MKDSILADTALRLYRIVDDYENYEVLNLISQMTSMASYEVFGHSIKSIEGAEYIHSMVLNGLYDDSYIGVCKNISGLPMLQAVGDDFKGPFLSPNDLVKLVTLSLQADTYRLSNADILRSEVPNRIQMAEEGRLDEYDNLPAILVRKEYRRLHNLYKEALRGYL